MEAPPSWRHLNLIPSQRPHLRIPSHWGSGLNIRVLRGCKHSVRGTSSSSPSPPTFTEYLFPAWLEAEAPHIEKTWFLPPATHTPVEIEGKPILMSQCGRGWAGGVHWLLVVHLRSVGWAPEFSRKQRSYKGPQQNVAVWEDTICLGKQDWPMLGHEGMAADQMALGGVGPWMLN